MTSFSEAVAKRDGETCPKCGKPSVSPPAEVFCVDCATEGWEKDATAHRALQQRGEDITVPDRDGVSVGVAHADHDVLVDVFLFLQEREKQFKEWRTAVEDELVRRHGDRRAAQVVGANEVDVDRKWSRQWDAEDLMATISELCNDRRMTLEDARGLVREVKEFKVDGKALQVVLQRAPVDVREEIERCFEWKSGRATIKVTPVASLEP